MTQPTINSAKAAVSRATSIAASDGKKVMFDTRSPLSDMEHVMMSLPVLPVGSSIDDEALYQSWVYSEGQSDKIAQFIEESTETVNATMSTIRTEVLPMVKEFSETLESAIKSYKEAEDHSYYTVKRLGNIRVAEQNPGIFGLDGYKKVTLPVFSSIGRYTDKEDSIGVAGKVTSIAGTDRDMLLGWVEGNGAESLTAMHERFFRQPVDSKALKAFYAERTALEAMDDSFALFLMAHAWMQEIDESASGMSLEIYKTSLEGLKTYSAVMYHRGYVSLNSLATGKKVILSVKPMKHMIEVIGSNYDEYIKQGGSLESLTGAAMDRHLNPRLDAMIKDAVKHDRLYKNRLRVTEVSRDKRALEFIKSTLRRTIKERSKDLSDLEMSYHGGEHLPSNITDSGDVFVNGLTLSDLGDMNSIALRYVAGIRYAYTPAMEIISEIDHMGVIDPEITIDEALIYAKASYIGSYIGEQIITRSK